MPPLKLLLIMAESAGPGLRGPVRVTEEVTVVWAIPNGGTATTLAVLSRKIDDAMHDTRMYLGRIDSGAAKPFHRPIGVAAFT